MKLNPTDVNGNPVETFIYNGTTYVPLRAVSESLGKAVDWDGTNQRVYIGEVPGQKQYLLDVCPPYQTNSYSAPATITMAGQTYANGFSFAHGYALFNLNGQYNTLSFDVGHIDGRGMSNHTVNIYLDSKLSFSLELTGEMLPKHYELPLNGANQMKIEVTGPYGTNGHYYGFANVEVY